MQTRMRIRLEKNLHGYLLKHSLIPSKSQISSETEQVSSMENKAVKYVQEAYR